MISGHGAMGISNSIGSNVFDVLLCLGLPWFLKAAFFPKAGNHYVTINSHGLVYSSISLFSTLTILYLSLLIGKFKLTRTVGIVCLVMYVIFLIFASILELNMFFVVNLPVCVDWHLMRLFCKNFMKFLQKDTKLRIRALPLFPFDSSIRTIELLKQWNICLTMNKLRLSQMIQHLINLLYLFKYLHTFYCTILWCIYIYEFVQECVLKWICEFNEYNVWMSVYWDTYVYLYIFFCK